MFQYLTRFSLNEDVTAEDRTDAKRKLKKMIYSASAPLHPDTRTSSQFPGDGNSRLFRQSQVVGIGKKGLTWSFWNSTDKM
uniref:Uncharacterized protein n=1 Tax=Ditylenchus dipsaci TaxID=166011 RepID=A0A915D788_9BILA